MASTTFNAVDPKGKTHTRTSATRTYTHVVLVRTKGHPDEWGAFSWVGRPDLVETRKAEAMKRTRALEAIAVEVSRT